MVGNLAREDSVVCQQNGAKAVHQGFMSARLQNVEMPV
jgi:hypothetical protein